MRNGALPSIWHPCISLCSRIISLLSLQQRPLLYSLHRMDILWTDFELQERPMKPIRRSVNQSSPPSMGRTKLQSRQSSLIWRICGCIIKIEQLCPTLELQSILPGTIWWLLFSYGGGAVSSKHFLTLWVVFLFLLPSPTLFETGFQWSLARI